MQIHKRLRRLKNMALTQNSLEPTRANVRKQTIDKNCFATNYYPHTQLELVSDSQGGPSLNKVEIRGGGVPNQPNQPLPTYDWGPHYLLSLAVAIS